jgi:hypothetical protein
MAVLAAAGVIGLAAAAFIPRARATVAQATTGMAGAR